MEFVFTAKDFEELKNKLRSINVEVPHCPKDRTNQHVETYSLISLLGSLQWDSLCFPVEVYRRERPDFLVVCNSRKIGLEHTEATNQNLAKERALRADGHGPEMHFVTPASVHDPVLPKGKVLAQIQADEVGEGWCGDSVERNWAEAIAHFIDRKAANATKDGYELYEDNRLMIYDNWPAPALKHQRALQHLRERLKDSVAWSIFKRVYIIGEHTIVELSADNNIYHCGRR